MFQSNKTNNSKIFTTAITTIWVATALLGTVPSAMAMKYHDNNLQVTTESYEHHFYISSASYLIDDYLIREGQDPDGKIYQGLTVNSEGFENELTFKVGRKGADYVANWFNEHLEDNGTHKGSNNFPNKLNFAFIGQFKVTLFGDAIGYTATTYYIDDFVIGQGKSRFQNNDWWIGGKNCSKDIPAGTPHKKGELVCKLTNTNNNTTIGLKVSSNKIFIKSIWSDDMEKEDRPIWCNLGIYPGHRIGPGSIVHDYYCR